MTLTIRSIKMRYIIKKRKCFRERNMCGIFRLVIVIKLGGHVTKIF